MSGDQAAAGLFPPPTRPPQPQKNPGPAQLKGSRPPKHLQASPLHLGPLRRVLRMSSATFQEMTGPDLLALPRPWRSSRPGPSPLRVTRDRALGPGSPPPQAPARSRRLSQGSRSSFYPTDPASPALAGSARAPHFRGTHERPHEPPPLPRPPNLLRLPTRSLPPSPPRRGAPTRLPHPGTGDSAPRQPHTHRPDGGAGTGAGKGSCASTERQRPLLRRKPTRPRPTKWGGG